MMVIRFCGPFWDFSEEPRQVGPNWVRGEATTVYDVPNVMLWLLQSRGEARANGAARFASLMRELKPEQWPRLYTSFARAEIRPQDVKALAALAPDDAVEMLGVATLNRNGYVREPAVWAMAQLEHPRAIPYLLLRLGDWVQQVRLAASDVLRALMTPDNAPVFLEHHRLLRRLGDMARTELSAIRGEIDAYLTSYLKSPTVRPALMDGLRSQEASVRQFCYQTLAASGPLEPKVIEAAARDSSPVVRRWIAGRIARGETAASDELRRTLIRDRAAVVSTSIIRRLGEEDIRRFRDDLLELAFAATRLVRHAARFALRSEGVDFAEMARRRIALERQLVPPGVVATLAEIGDARDIEQLRPFIDHPKSAMRDSAMAGLTRLNPSGALDLALARLDDSSSHVRSEAIAAIRARSRSEWREPVERALAQGPAPAQMAALQLLLRLGYWDSLLAAMQAATSEHEAVRCRGEERLLATFSRYGIWAGIAPPPREVRRRLAALWPGVAGLQPPRRMEEAWKEFGAWAESLREAQQ